MIFRSMMLHLYDSKTKGSESVSFSRSAACDSRKCSNDHNGTIGGSPLDDCHDDRLKFSRSLFLLRMCRRDVFRRSSQNSPRRDPPYSIQKYEKIDKFRFSSVLIFCNSKC